MTPREYARQLLEQLAADTKAELNRRMKERRKVKADDPKVQRIVQKMKANKKERQRLAARIQRLYKETRRLEDELYKKYRFIVTPRMTLQRPKTLLLSRDDYLLAHQLDEVIGLDRGFVVGEKTLKKFDFRFDEEDTELVAAALKRLENVLSYLVYDVPVASDEDAVFDTLKKIVEGS